MRLNVNPNRMELLKIKRRLIIARRGHKLLKDKQEELIRQFMILIKEVQNQRVELKKKLSQLYINYIMSVATQAKRITDYAVFSLGQELTVTKKQKIVMNMPIAEFTFVFGEITKNYSLTDTSAKFDAVFRNSKEVFPMLLKLAEMERKLTVMAAEIEKTRRRVNALEYIFIPNLIETVKYITMKMSELERDALTRLMKVKEIVRSH
ncbi:MAG: V-type sodium ATPase subunit D [Elusimicrobia bacterium ADurb.Bin231]|nr:MAG: V-type sodium ATPase subunit D [Elusimicrobia bacterium ADurb.Bin231]